MTYELIDRTVREWVRANPERGARTLDRLAKPNIFHAAAHTTEEIAETLIELAGRMEIAKTRLW